MLLTSIPIIETLPIILSLPILINEKITEKTNITIIKMPINTKGKILLFPDFISLSFCSTSFILILIFSFLSLPCIASFVSVFLVSLGFLSLLSIKFSPLV